MPFPFRSKNKKEEDASASSPELSTQKQLLIYAQPSYAPSERDFVPSSSSGTTIRPRTHKAISTDIFADVTYFKEQQEKKAAAAKARAEAEGAVDEEEGGQAEEAFERPATPPQGSRTIPWEPYHDLPANHPVFLYPDAEREKMYKKGIDPVVRAMADRALAGKSYGDKNNPVKGYYKRGQRLMNNFGTMSIGAYGP